MRTTITVYTARGGVILRFSLDLLPAFNNDEESKSGLRDLWELSRTLLARFSRADNVECVQIDVSNNINRLVTTNVLPAETVGAPSDPVMIGARIVRENILRFEEVKPEHLQHFDPS